VVRDDFLKKGITLRYSYFDKDKQPIASVAREAFFSRAAHDLNHAICDVREHHLCSILW
jgi:hypothetical protein